MTPAARTSAADPAIVADAAAVNPIHSAIDVHLDSLATPSIGKRPMSERFEAARAIRASRPAGSRFMPAVERPAPTYLAFGSAEHLTRYLRVRATLTPRPGA
jgi:hypothetical protein